MPWWGVVTLKAPTNAGKYHSNYLRMRFSTFHFMIQLQKLPDVRMPLIPAQPSRRCEDDVPPVAHLDSQGGTQPPHGLHLFTLLLFITTLDAMVGGGYTLAPTSAGKYRSNS